jgi:hypothetical protein
MNAKPTRIAIEQPDGSFRKITMLVPYGEGGFGILVPLFPSDVR